jgi:hypothetical protein
LIKGKYQELEKGRGNKNSYFSHTFYCRNKTKKSRFGMEEKDDIKRKRKAGHL